VCNRIRMLSFLGQFQAQTPAATSTQSNVNVNKQTAPNSRSSHSHSHTHNNNNNNMQTRTHTHTHAQSITGITHKQQQHAHTAQTHAHTHMRKDQSPSTSTSTVWTSGKVLSRKFKLNNNNARTHEISSVSDEIPKDAHNNSNNNDGNEQTSKATGTSEGQKAPLVPTNAAHTHKHTFAHRHTTNTQPRIPPPASVIRAQNAFLPRFAARPARPQAHTHAHVRSQNLRYGNTQPGAAVAM